MLGRRPDGPVHLPGGPARPGSRDPSGPGVRVLLPKSHNGRSQATRVPVGGWAPLYPSSTHGRPEELALPSSGRAHGTARVGSFLRRGTDEKNG